MPRLAGLTGLYGELDTDPAGSIDEGAYQVYDQRAGFNEAHALTGDTAGQVYPAGTGSGWSGQAVYESTGDLGEWANVPGYDPGNTHGPIDYTPSTHGGLYPRPSATDISILDPDALAVVGEQLRGLHGTEQGGTVVLYDAPGGHEEPTNTTTDRYSAPNVNGLRKAAGHLRGIIGGLGGMGGGSHLGQADVDQGYGELNSLVEFQEGHSIRVVQHDTLHFDFTGLHAAEEGTWLGKHPVGTNVRFDGPDSPYNVEGDFEGSFRAGNASTLGYPTEYASPPAPTVLPAAPQVDVFASGRFF